MERLRHFLTLQRASKTLFESIKPPGGGIKRKHPHFLGKLGEQGEVMLGEESRVREEDKPYKKVTRGARKDASGRRQETRNMMQKTSAPLGSADILDVRQPHLAA